MRRSTGDRGGGAHVVPAATMLRTSPAEEYLREVTGSGEPLPVVAPATGETVASVRRSTGEDVERAASVARAAQPAWAARTVAERAAVLDAVHDVVLARQDELTDLVQLVTGKSRGDAVLEVVGALQAVRWFATRGPALLRPQRRHGFAPLLSRAEVRRTPVGLVANIAAWNYPLVFVLGDAVPMLLAGNAVLTKPDLRSTPLAGAVATVLRRAGLPDGLFHVLAGNDPGLGEAVVDVADHVLFTGSEVVGRKVAARAASRLTSCTLELGGKNAMYVAADADVPRAAAAAVRDCFTGAGQTCTSTERLYVHADVAEQLRTELVRRVGAVRLGWSRDPSVGMGSLVSPEHLRTVLDHVQDARDRGATVLTGGAARPDLGPAFMAPTVLADVPDGARCLREETFGPVVVLHEVGSDAEALQAMNDTPTGLMASIFSRDVARAERLARQVRAGTVVVNEVHLVAWGSVAAPIGGLGTSGLGRRYGPEGLAELTRAQVVLTQHGRLVSAVSGLPARPRGVVLLAAARLMKRLGRP